MDYSICVLNLSEENLTDSGLSQRLSETPENSIVLLEDVDSAFISRQIEEKSNTAFQGLF